MGSMTKNRSALMEVAAALEATIRVETERRIAAMSEDEHAAFLEREAVESELVPLKLCSVCGGPFEPYAFGISHGPYMHVKREAKEPGQLRSHGLPRGRTRRTEGAS